MTCPDCGKQGVHTCSPQLKEVKMTEVERLAHEGMELHEYNAPEYIVCAAVISQAQEIERLQSEIDNIKQVEFPRRLDNVTKPLIAERDQLRAEIERLRDQRDDARFKLNRLKDLIQGDCL